MHHMSIMLWLRAEGSQHLSCAVHWKEEFISQRMVRDVRYIQLMCIGKESIACL